MKNLLLNKLKENHNIKIISNDIKDIRNPDKFQETLKAIEEGHNIIYQAVLHDNINKFYGSPDLLVKANYINKLFGYKLIEDNDDDYYIPIEIKCSSILLSSDNIHIRNSGRVKYYKTQLYMYLKMLNSIINIKSKKKNNNNNHKAYIIGKKYKNKNNIYNYNEKIATVDFNTYDKNIVEHINKAIDTVYKIKTEGSKWSLLPKPTNSLLYPNMCKDTRYPELYDNLNNILHDITTLWYCGIKNRNYAHNKNVFRYDDINCNTKTLNISTKNVRHNNIMNIIQINKQDNMKIIPTFFDENSNWYKENKDTLEVFIDYETFNDEIENGVINLTSNAYIFMIGVTYRENDIVKYKNFLMKKKSLIEESNMIHEFEIFIFNLMQKTNCNKVRMYHWGHHEKLCNNIFETKHNIKLFNNMNVELFNLLNVFRDNHIAIKDCFNYKLKSVGKALHKHNLIKTIWDKDNICMNGKDAMIIALNCYNKNEIESDMMNKIIHYNSIDCNVLYEILDLLRNI
jgi:hypothetical protein